MTDLHEGTLIEDGIHCDNGECWCWEKPDQLPSKEQADIVDELEARGDDLSLRAARYIRIKRQTALGARDAYRSLAERTLEEERHG